MSHIMLSFTSVPLVKAEMKPHNLYDSTHTLEDFFTCAFLLVSFLFLSDPPFFLFTPLHQPGT